MPAALLGADPGVLLDRARTMAQRCASTGSDNPALELGVVLGELALAGRDKPTLIAPPGLASFGAWLEQLVAESLGKAGQGHHSRSKAKRAGAPDVYGSDRVFVHLRSAGAPDAAADAAVERLERAGHPVVRIEWADRYALGAEFYRWEFATAVAGAVLGVNPFDQPDVEAAKIVTRRLAGEYETTGTLSDDEPPLQDAGDITALLDQLREGDYFAMLAFIEMNQAHRNALDAIRGLVRDRRKVATTVGFGPRYLHSTGQAHKGGPNSGVFLVITCDDAEDLPVPGQRYSFGTIKRLQARGDFEVLASRGRRVLRVHLKDVEKGLRDLHAIIADIRVTVSAGLQPCLPDMNSRPALRIVFGLPQHLARDRRRVSLAEHEKLQQVRDGIAFGPSEVRVRDDAWSYRAGGAAARRSRWESPGSDTAESGSLRLRHLRRGALR